MTTKREIFIMCEVKMYVNYSWELGRGFKNFSETFFWNVILMWKFSAFLRHTSFNFLLEVTKFPRNVIPNIGQQLRRVITEAFDRAWTNFDIFCRAPHTIFCNNFWVPCFSGVFNCD
jgi:hypothetical protein